MINQKQTLGVSQKTYTECISYMKNTPKYSSYFYVLRKRESSMNIALQQILLHDD